MIKSKLTEYDPVDLLNFVLATAIYPPNKRFQIRFEVLVQLICSIDEKEFRCEKNLTREDLEEILGEFNREYSHYFQLTEDVFVPDELEKIPFFLDGTPYLFFFGILKRSYEYWEHFVENYFVLNDFFQVKLGYTPISALKVLLILQNRLKQPIISFFESKGEKPDYDRYEILIPDNEFIELCMKFFTFNEEDLLTIFNAWKGSDRRKFIECTTVRMGEVDSNFNPALELNREVFGYTFIKIGNTLISNLPQISLEILYKHFFERLSSMESVWEEINQKLRDSMFRNMGTLLLNFFDPNKVVPRVFFVRGNSSSSSVDLATIFDYNKLFLIQAVPFKFERVRSLTEIAEEIQEKLKKIRDFFYERETVQAHSELSAEWQAKFLSTASIEVIEIIVFDTMSLNPFMIGWKNQAENVLTWTTLFMNFKAILEDLESPLALLKYLKAWKSIPSRMISFDEMDKYGFYKSNDQCFLKVGVSPDLIIFNPYIWAEISLKKAKNNTKIRSIRESQFGLHNVKEMYENVYLTYSKVTLNAAYVVVTPQKKIYILFNLGTKLLKNELRISEFLSHLIAYYLSKIGEEFWNLIEESPRNLNSDLSIVVKPRQLIERDEKQSVSEGTLEKLSIETPIVSSSGLMPSGNQGVLLVFDMETLHYKFSTEDNAGERYVVSVLLKELFKLFYPVESDSIRTSKVKGIIEHKTPLGRKSFSLDSIYPRNNTIGLREPFKFEKADIYRVNQEVARFLVSKDIQPGLYTEKAATDLNNGIFKLLQTKLEQELQKYSFEDALFYFYSELENAHSHRMLERLRLGMTMRNVTEYDPLEKMVELEKETARITLAIRHIIETLVKNPPNGAHPLTLEDWSYLQALAIVAVETCFLSDYVYHNIQAFGIRINDDYSFTDELLDSGINIQGYRTKTAQDLLLENERRSHELREQIEHPKPTEFSEELLELDEAFKEEYGYAFRDFIKAIAAVAYFPVTEENPFAPLTLIEEGELIRYINEKTGIQIEIVTKVLKDFNLNVEILKPEEIRPWEFRSRKNRMSRKPLIKYSKRGQTFYLFGNWIVEIVLKSYYFGAWQGRLPITTRKIRANSLKEALENLRDKSTKEHQKYACEIANDNFIIVECPLKKFKKYSLPERGEGEIDVLAIDSDTKTIFIFEAKDISRGLAPRDIKNEINKFYDPENGYLAKLYKKSKFIRENIQKILQYYNIKDLENWKVIATFVTKNIHFSAFYQESELVEFITINEMQTYIQEMKNRAKIIS